LIQALELMSDDTKVSCDTHGESNTTYVCEHLVRNPVQRWYSEASCLGRFIAVVA